MLGDNPELAGWASGIVSYGLCCCGWVARICCSQLGVRVGLCSKHMLCLPPRRAPNFVVVGPCAVLRHAPRALRKVH